jgi:hypothetical protein
MSTKPNRIAATRSYSMVGNRQVRVILRDTITPEDPYINLAYAKALAIRTDELYAAKPIRRSVKDHLIKTNITI